MFKQYPIHSLIIKVFTSEIIEVVSQTITTNLLKYPGVLRFDVISQKSNEIFATWELRKLGFGETIIKEVDTKPDLLHVGLMSIGG